MRLLVAVDQFSDPPLEGNSGVAYHWARHLRRRGHQVDLVVLRRPRDPAWDGYFRRYDIGAPDIRVRHRPLPLRAWAPLAGIPQSLLHFDDRDVARQVVDRGYDAVVLVSIYMTALAERLRTSLPVLLMATDSPTLHLESLLHRRGGPWQKAWWWIQARLWDRVERRRFRALPALAFVAERDARNATRHWATAGSDRVHVIPLGVDADHFDPAGASPIPTELLLNGGLRSPDSVDGAIWFMDRVLPRIREAVPDVRFRMVGRSPHPDLERRAAREPGALIHGDVPDLRPYFRQAGVVVCPLFSGSGVKNRILEPLAMARPVVATSTFPRAMGLEAGVHLLTADDPVAFADAVIGLVRDPGRGDRLGAAGRRVVIERFAWEAAAARVEGILRTLGAA